MTIYPYVYAQREQERLIAELKKILEEKTSSVADEWVPQLASFEALAEELFGSRDDQ